MTDGRDIVAGARAMCRARWRTRERGEGEKRPLLFIAQKVKKGDFTLLELPENWSSTALFDVRFTGQGGPNDHSDKVLSCSAESAQLSLVWFGSTAQHYSTKVLCHYANDVIILAWNNDN